MATDKEIAALIDDERMGSWHDDGEFQVYTPNPSIFAKVAPLELLNVFLDMPEEDKVRLNLP